MRVDSPRVVITGMGLISPLGNEPARMWEAIVGRQSGIRQLVSEATRHLPTAYGAEAWEFTGAIDDFGPVDGGTKRNIRKGLKVMCREIQMGVAAAQRALADARWTAEQLDPDRVGAVFGSDYITTMPEEFSAAIQRCVDQEGRFAFSRWGVEGIPQISPLWLLKYLPNMPACHVAIYNDLRGPNNSITVREASPNLALLEAVSTIQRGGAEVIVVGATGSRLHPLRSIHIALQEMLAEGQTDPLRLSRPFDRSRTGMVLGEGAAALVVEREDVAVQRGARIYGEIVGCGSSSVIDRRGVGNRRQALVNVMRQSLSTAGLSVDQIGHVHAHGLGTWLSDRDEGQAICHVFSERQSPVPLVAAKSYFGNLGAAGGMVELSASLLAMDSGQLFPILNLDELDWECIPAGARVLPVRDDSVSAGQSVLNINVTPQGQASAALVAKYS